MSFLKRLFAKSTPTSRVCRRSTTTCCAISACRAYDLYEARRARRAASFLQERAAERAASWIR